MRRNYLKIVVIITLAALFLPTVGLALTLGEMEAEIMCDCGCTMVLNTCSCGRSDAMRTRIETMIGQGSSKDEIINTFVSQYGEIILSAPTRKGFNLVAYIAPMTIFVLGLMVVIFLIRRWRLSGQEEGQDASMRPALDEAMIMRINRELKVLEEV